MPLPEMALLTDETGSVELNLPAGVFAFRARGRDDTSGEVELTSPGGCGECHSSDATLNT